MLIYLKDLFYRDVVILMFISEGISIFGGFVIFIIVGFMVY